MTDLPIRVFSTLPQSSAVERDYLAIAAETARWSEDAGCVGALIYTDNSLLDPWVVAQAVLGHTERLAPLIAVQPVYMHPYNAAKLVTSIGHLYGRPVFLNMVAGGFVNDLHALDDQTEHDERYERLVEYTSIVLALLGSEDAVSFAGKWYRIKNVRLKPRLDQTLMPGITVSGSSLAGARAAQQLGATAIQYPRPAGDYSGSHDLEIADKGIRIGIIAREDALDAWRLAWSRFPSDERGQLTHRLAMRASDSVWHRQLSVLAEESTLQGNPYWLHPFENYRTFCPYLVGSYDEVARAVGEYLDLGFRTFITDIPRVREDLEHVAVVFERARAVPAT